MTIGLPIITLKKIIAFRNQKPMTEFLLFNCTYLLMIVYYAMNEITL